MEIVQIAQNLKTLKFGFKICDQLADAPITGSQLNKTEQTEIQLVDTQMATVN